MNLTVWLGDADNGYKVQWAVSFQRCPSGTDRSQTIPWMMTQHVQQVCEQHQTGRVSDTVEGRAARQRDRPKKMTC